MPYISKEALNDSPILGQLQDIFPLFLLLKTIWISAGSILQVQW